jgi:replicative DNA helicase
MADFVAKFARSSGARVPQSVSLMEMGGKVPPHSADAEIAVLGSMMLDKTAMSKVMEIITPETMYNEKNRLIFEAIVAMSERSITVDFISLKEQLLRHGKLEQIEMSYLMDINAKTPSAANVEQYARIVLEHYLKRQMIEAATVMLRNCYDTTVDALEEIDRAESSIFDIAEKRLRKSYISMKSLAGETFTTIMKMREHGQSDLAGVRTGYRKLDEMLGGLQRSDMLIIAARPSMGKTAFAMSIARNVAVESKMPVAVFSLEMAAQQLAIRLLSAEAQVNAQAIRTGQISNNDLKKLASKTGALSEAPIFIDDSPGLTVMELRAKCRRLKAEKDIGLVVVDYLQFMHAPKAESREREISVISRSIKMLAKELNIPILVLSQLNRSVESRPKTQQKSSLANREMDPLAPCDLPT